MNRVCSIFSQILHLIPRPQFEVRVREHKAERHARGFGSWTQFIGMLFCQLGHAQSLREITGGLAACEGKLRHLGVSEPPRRSTLSYANQHRPWELFRSVFYDLLKTCQQEAAGSKRKFRFKHKLLSIDSTTIALSLSMFDWAQYKRSKGAVKLHLVLDHDGYLPQYAVISNGKQADISAARKMSFAPGTMLVFDRGYADYDWWLSLMRQKVFFVTRLKDNADYEVVEKREVPENSNVRKDEVIFLFKQAAADTNCYLRRIEVWVEEKQETMVFVTSHLKLSASTIAAIVIVYRIGKPVNRLVEETFSRKVEAPQESSGQTRTIQLRYFARVHDGVAEGRESGGGDRSIEAEDCLDPTAMAGLT